MPLTVATFLSLTTHSVDGAIRGYAGGLSAIAGSSGEHSWIDDAVGRNADVGYLYGTSTDLFAEASLLWQTEFWNRSVRQVYNLGSPEPVGFAETTLKVNPTNGRLAGATGAAAPTYMAVANGFDIVRSWRDILRSSSTASRRPFGSEARFRASTATAGWARMPPTFGTRRQAIIAAPFDSRSHAPPGEAQMSRAAC